MVMQFLKSIRRPIKYGETYSPDQSKRWGDREEAVGSQVPL